MSSSEVRHIIDQNSVSIQNLNANVSGKIDVSEIGNSVCPLSGGFVPAINLQPINYTASEIGNSGLIGVPDCQSALDYLETNKIDTSEIGNSVCPLSGGFVPAINLQPINYTASEIGNSGLIGVPDCQSALDYLETNKIGSTFTGPVDVNSQDLNNVVNINGVAYEAPELRHVEGPYQVGTGGSVTWNWSHGVPGYKFVSVPVWLSNGIHGVTATSISSFMVTDATFTQTFNTAIQNYTPKGIIAKI